MPALIKRMRLMLCPGLNKKVQAPKARVICEVRINAFSLTVIVVSNSTYVQESIVGLSIPLSGAR